MSGVLAEKKTTNPSSNKQFYEPFSKSYHQSSSFCDSSHWLNNDSAATTVQAHTTANRFNDGFAKAKVHLADNQTSSCPTHGRYCQQLMSGYETE
ncbi:MAG: hypothetical protein WBE34_18270 [Candidatus Nitrosopolaris sp.]